MPKMPGKRVRAPEVICGRAVKKAFKAVRVQARARAVQLLINIQEREGVKAKGKLRAAMPPVVPTPAGVRQVLISIQGRTEVRSKVGKSAKVRANWQKVAANRVAVLKAAAEWQGVIRVNR